MTRFLLLLGSCISVVGLQLLLGFASVAILGSEYGRNHDHISQFQIRDPPQWWARSLCLLLVETMWPSYIPSQARGSLFNTSYGKGYGRGSRTRFHARLTAAGYNTLNGPCSKRLFSYRHVPCCRGSMLLYRCLVRCCSLAMGKHAAIYRSRGNAVSIATGYWLDVGGVGFRVSIDLRIFSSP
jgi:hypothetical protein